MPVQTASGMENMSDAASGRPSRTRRPWEIRNRGHQRNRPSITKRTANEAWADMKRNVDMVDELQTQIDQAHANQQWAVADALGKQQRRWLENLKRPRGILDQVHPTEPDSAQQTDQN